MRKGVSQLFEEVLFLIFAVVSGRLHSSVCERVPHDADGAGARQGSSIDCAKENHFSLISFSN